MWEGPEAGVGLGSETEEVKGKADHAKPWATGKLCVPLWSP